jgi:epoxyqueuosine reductase QueG
MMNENSDDQNKRSKEEAVSEKLSAEELRNICIEEGADDTGFVEIQRRALSSEQADILRIFPGTKTIVSIVKKANRESIRSPSMAVADLEYSKVYSGIADIAGRIIQRLDTMKVRGVVIPPGFPMDMTRWPGKVWEVSHKPMAVEAGLGHMGRHRVLIHPVFGSHIALDTLLIDAGLDRYDEPLKESPCLKCGLCTAVCPVGAISREGVLDFMSCAMHNYHELFGGFQEWIEEIVSSRDVKSYRHKFRDSETGSKWQSLTYGHAYRCSYCMAICPAGGETSKKYLSAKQDYIEKYFKPLKNKREPVYVIAGTRAEKTALKNQAKEIRYVKNTIRPASIASFLDGTGLLFNPEKAEGLRLTLHFNFTGRENKSATIAVSDNTVSVREGHDGDADLRINTDSETWVRILNEEISPFSALITGRMRLKGNPLYLKKFKSCIL